MDVKQHIKDAVRKATGKDVDVVIGALPEGIDDATMRRLVSETIEKMVSEIKRDDKAEGSYMGAVIKEARDDDEPCCPAATVASLMAATCLITIEAISSAAAKDDMDAIKRALVSLPIRQMKSLLDKL